MPENEDTLRWYAVYTRPRTEKKVRDMLETSGIECYLPMQKTLRLWSDRKKWVSLPLFHSYIFVHIDLKDYYSVLKTDGVVRFIRFNNEPTPVPENQIMAVRMYEESGEFTREEEFNIRLGDDVEIIQGPLKGLYGRLISLGRRKKVRIMIEGVQQSIYLHIPKSFLRKVPGRERG